MKLYLALFKINFITFFSYRLSQWIGIASLILLVFIKLLVYAAFFEGEPQSISFAQTVDYIWLTSIFGMMISLEWQDNGMLSGVRTGSFAYDLLRPRSVYLYYVARITAFRLSLSLTPVVVLGMLALALPSPYSLSLPSGQGAVFFIISLFFALCLVSSLSMCTCVLVFITTQSNGPRLLLGALSGFFMGAVVPLPLMPDSFQKVLSFMPFKYMADVPFRIYSGHIIGSDVFISLLVQLLWAVALFLISYISFNRILKSAVINGG